MTSRKSDPYGYEDERRRIADYLGISHGSIRNDWPDQKIYESRVNAEKTALPPVTPDGLGPCAFCGGVTHMTRDEAAAMCAAINEVYFIRPAIGKWVPAGFSRRPGITRDAQAIVDRAARDYGNSQRDRCTAQRVRSAVQ